MNQRCMQGGARGRVAAGVLGALLACAASADNHQPNLMFQDSFEGSSGKISATDAARFLAQATFGPTDADIANLRTVGYDAWLADQFAAPVTHEMAYINWAHDTLGEQIGQTHRLEAWFLGALGGPDPANNTIVHRDQLRQRMAFALSELLVISQQNALLASSPRAVVSQR